MTRTDKPGPRMATERWFDVAEQVSDAQRDGPKPRLRWRHSKEGPYWCVRLPGETLLACTVEDDEPVEEWFLLEREARSRKIA